MRNLSPQEMFIALAAEHIPLHAFGGQKFADWKSETLPKVKQTLGDFPERVPLNPEKIVEWNHDGLIKEKWWIDVGPSISAVYQVNRPMSSDETKKYPAICCCHGHGPFGKEPVMGNESMPEIRDQIDQHAYNYGHVMAKHGFVTYAIDWIGFGERNDNNKPNWKNNNGSRDWCNLYYLHATMLGMTSLSINIAHGQAATDFTASLPFVDENNLAIMGLSGGGTMALWLALCDERFKAAEIICYSDLWKCFGIRDCNYCGMQVAPGLYKLVDLPDLQGLLAPKPLLIDLGVHDPCFPIASAMKCYEKLETIYKAAGALDKLELDLHHKEHAWGCNKSFDFFEKYLYGDAYECS